MAGFRTFATGEVLTAANVNDFLMKQSVMVFATAAARTTALGAQVVEGMLTYNKATDQLEVFDGTDFVPVGGGGGYDDVEVITATNASWPVPVLGDPIVKISVIGGGGGGGAEGSQGGEGGTTTFGVGSAFELAALGGQGGQSGGRNNRGQDVGRLGFVSGNGGRPLNNTINNSGQAGSNGIGGEIKVAYVDLTAVVTVSVVIGAGGSGQGGRGEVIVEYKAG